MIAFPAWLALAVLGAAGPLPAEGGADLAWADAGPAQACSVAYQPQPSLLQTFGQCALEPVDAGAAPDEGMPVPNVGNAVDAGTDSEPPLAEAPPPEPTDFTSPSRVRFYGDIRSRLGFDPAPGQPTTGPLGGNLANLRSWALLGGEATFGQRFKIVAEVRARHRAVEQAPPPGEAFLLFNGRAAKATFEAYPGEAYLDWYTAAADFRFGQQVIALGANAQGAPADVLSPLDLREGVLFADPADVKLPVLAARARGNVEGFDWTAVYVPFFVPDRFDLYGQNEALIQPGLGAALPSVLPLDRSVEDRQGASLIQTERPKDLPQFGDLGLRITHDVGPVRLGADYVLTREKLPQVHVDPELARFLSEGANAPFTDPATALSLSQRLGAGEKLLQGTFPRYQVGEVEGSMLAGPVQLDADLGYSPSRLYVDARYNPVRHPTWTGALTVADARGTDLTLAASAIVLWVTGIPQGERLVIIDLPGAEQSAHDTFGAGLIGLAGYKLLRGKLELEARLFFDARQRSRALSAKGMWNFTDRIHATLGAELYGGPELSPLGYFHRDDSVYGAIRVDL